MGMSRQLWIRLATHHRQNNQTDTDSIHVHTYAFLRLNIIICLSEVSKCLENNNTYKKYRKIVYPSVLSIASNG